MLLLAVLVGGYFLLIQGAAEGRKDDAVAGAAKSVERNGDTIGTAVGGDG